MKDDKEHIDQLFESLNDRQFDIPEAFLEDLNKRLDNNEPKKKRYFLLWFLLPIVSLGAIAIIYFQGFDTSEIKQPVNQANNKMISKDENNEHANTPDNLPSAEQNQNTHYPADSVHTSITGKSLSTAKQMQVEKKQFKASEKGTKQTNSSDQVGVSQRTFKTKKNQTGQFSLSKKLKTENGKSHTAIRADKRSKRVKSKGNGTLQKPGDVQTPSSKKKGQSVLNPGADEKMIRDKIAPASIPDPIVNASSTTKQDKEELSKESVPEKETDSATAQNTVDTTQQVNSSQAEKDGITSKPPTDKWKKEIKLFAGLGGNSMHDSPKNSEYLAKIKEHQTSILAPSFGVSANLSYKKFTFGTGVNYEQTGEKFKVDIKSGEAKDSTYSELIQDTIWVQDTSGVLIPILHDTTIYHTVQYIDSTAMSRSFQNRYSWISIPIHFGYRFELGNYELIPRIGAVFNFGIAQKGGTYPNASFNDVNQYKLAKFNVSYLVQLEVRRNFDKWFVFVNPYFQSMINPSVSGDIIRRRYTSWGMQFGIGLNL